MKKLLFSLLFLSAAGLAQEGSTYVSEPVIPSITPALRDLPAHEPGSALYTVEAKRRDDNGFAGPDLDMPPHGNPLAELQMSVAPPSSRAQRAISAPIVNIEGMDYNVYPPDPTGDVGPSHVVQGVNGDTSMIQVFNKSGSALTGAIAMQSLATAAPCTSGFCDPIVLYDWAADRWMISEFDRTADILCIYVSTTPDPTGTWYYYSFDPPGGNQDYPHYGVWPAADNNAYFMGANNGGYVIALERDKMLAGQAARMLSSTIPLLSGFGFQLSMPANHAGEALPPAASGGFFLRPRDTEIHGGTCTNCDLIEIYEYKVTWGATPVGTFTQITSAQLTDWDQTVCGTAIFGCMPQMGTSQLLDPIREPVHFPLQYRNWGAYETLVAGFVEDVDGTDQAAVHWFELRRTPPGTGNWTRYQEGVLANDAYHRGVTSVAMDGSGNIALGYARTNSASYAGSYYAGRLASDPLNTLSTYDNLIRAGAGYQSSADRWGDYAGMGVDPVDDCTFWFFGMYEETTGSSATRIASFRFDECGCDQEPSRPTATATAVQPDEIDIRWNDSDLAAVTEYRVYRSETAGGPYALIATVPDINPGPTGYTYEDTPLASGKTYYYVVDATDGDACTSELSIEVNATLYGTNIVYQSHASFTEVTGNMDGYPNQGEKWSVQVTLRNIGNLNATAVAATLSGDGLTACAPCAFGSIAAGGADTKTCTFTFVIDADFSTVNGCPADLEFGVVSKTCAEQAPAGLDELGVFSATVASGGLTTVNEAGRTGSLIAKTTTYYFTINNPVTSVPGVLTAATIDVSMIPPGYSTWSLTVAIEHDPDSSGTYDFSHTIFSGTVGGWTNVTGHSLSTMVTGSNPGNGIWRLRITNSGSGPNTNGTLTAWTLHLTSGAWSCTYTGAGSCGATPAPEVSDDAIHRMAASKNTNPALVNLKFESVGASHYQVYVSNSAPTAPFRVTDPAYGDTLCALSAWTGPDAGGMLSLTGVNLEGGITGSKQALFFLITADNGTGTEGPLGFATGPVARTADSYCNK